MRRSNAGRCLCHIFGSNMDRARVRGLRGGVCFNGTAETSVAEMAEQLNSRVGGICGVSLPFTERGRPERVRE